MLLLKNQTIFCLIKYCVLLQMIKTITFLSLLAVCWAIPVDEGSLQNPGKQLVGPQEVSPFGPPPGPHGPPQPVGGNAVEGKPADDLKTDPTFWFGYGRRYGYGYPSYGRSYYSYPR
jgi:hypothetical protein